MFAYMAFKGLRLGRNGNLYSPSMGSPWRLQQTPWGKYLGLCAQDGDLENGYGIFAVDYENALKYNNNVYLVFPDPNKKVVLGESGWRAERAFVYCKVDNVDEAARLIYAAHTAGYPQVEEILIWAGMCIGAPEIMQEFATATWTMRVARLKHAEIYDRRQAESAWFRYVEKITDRCVPYVVEAWPYLTRDAKYSIMWWVWNKRVNPADVPQLIDLFVTDFDEGIRVAVAREAMFYNDETALYVLRALLSSRELRVQHAIADACEMLGESALPILYELARKAKDQAVILYILNTCTRFKAKARDIIVLYAFHPDSNVSEYARRLAAIFEIDIEEKR